MEPSTLIGTVGVSLLLLAFLLNLFKLIDVESLPYIVINILGAAIACVASILIDFIPFVVLEIIWVVVGLAGLYKHYRKKNGMAEYNAPFALDTDRLEGMN